MTTVLQVVADTAVLGSVLLALGLLAILATRGWPSSRREYVATTALYLAWLAPFWATWYELTRPAPAIEGQTLATAVEQRQAKGPSLSPQIETGARQVADLPGPARAPSATESAPASAAWLTNEICFGLDAATLAASLWATGTVAGLLGLLFSLRRVRAIRRELPASTDPRVLRIAKAVAAALRVPVPDLRDSRDTIAPFSLGGTRGVVVVPATLAARLSDQELEAVLVHETAHVSHRHHGLGIQQRAMLAAYWWNPLAYLISRALDAIKEEVCDDHVVARQSDPKPFARCLVRIADLTLSAKPAVSAAVLPLGFDFTKRVRRLLGQQGPLIAMQPHSARRPLLYALCLVPMVVAPGFAGLAPRLVPQDKPTESRVSKRPPSCADYFPFREGACWEYELGDPKAEQRAKQTWTTVGEVQAGKHRCWETRIKGQYDAWDYVGERADGWYQYSNLGMGNARGVSPREPKLLLMCPLGVSLGWNWEEVMSVQQSAGLGGGGQRVGPSRDDLLNKHRVTIDAMDEVVRVKAGEFKALKVRDEVTGSYYGEGTTIRWYAPGVGLVKEVQTHKRWESEYVRELVRFTPGGAPMPAVDHEAILEKKIATIPQNTGGDLERTITWYDQEHFKTWFKARFARVNGFAWPFRVTAEGAELFDPASPSAWDLASRAEKHEFKDNGTDGGLLEALTRCVALAVGGTKGNAPQITRLPGGSVSTTEHGRGESRGSVAVRAGDWRGIVRVTVKDGEITRIDVEPMR